MGKFDGILIISDIDGTFLGKKSRIVPENLTAIEYFKSEGGLFTFASGRMHMNMKRVIPNAGEIANAPGIMANGSYMYDYTADRALEPVYMDGPLTAAALCYVRENYPGVGIRISTARGFLTDSVSGYIAKDLNNQFITNVIVRPCGEWAEICSDWYKVVLRDEPDRLDAIRADMEARFPAAFEYGKSAPSFFELQRVGCTKASMLARMRSIFEEKGIHLTVYACGDYENDLTMLKSADVACCPENALDSVKNVCDLHFCHCDSGMLADLIGYLDKKIV